MKQKSREKMISCLLLLITLILTGCTTENNMETQITASLTTCVDNTGKTYVSEYRDTGITPDYIPVSTGFWLHENGLYFVDNAGAQGQGIYKASTKIDEPMQKLPIDLGGAAVWTIVVNAGEDILYCMANNTMGTPFLAAYGQEGTLLWKQEFDDKLNQSINGKSASRMICDEEGRIYALFKEKILLFDNMGAYQGEIIVPGKSFIDINMCGENKVYVTYYEEAGKFPFLAQVAFETQTLIDNRNIIGNGMLYQGQGDALLICDDSSVYFCDPDSEKIVKLFELEDYNILSSRIQAIRQSITGEIDIICWEILNYNRAVELVKLTENQGMEVPSDGKQVITFLSWDTYGLMNQVVMDFNKQSKEYRVVLEQIPLEEDFYKGLNTRLVAKESADLLYMYDYTDIMRYIDKGVLEDITPYLEQSKVLKQEDFIEEVSECFKVEGKLYGMTTIFGIETLRGRVSEVGERTGWTTEEFLNWLRLHPEAKSEEGLAQSIILEFCLKGDLDAYIDKEQKKALFTQSDFKELLQAIHDLETDEKGHWDDWYQILEQGETILQRKVMQNLGQGGNAEEMSYQEELVYKGYPTRSGEARHFLQMSCIGMLSRSTCKDGAFAFLEYYMTYDNGISEAYSVFGEEYEANMEKAEDKWGLIDIGTVDEKEIKLYTDIQLERQKELLKYAVPDSYSNMVIRSIIIEEAQAYFEGAKGIDETCDIIQNRVQLYIDENELY